MNSNSIDIVSDSEGTPPMSSVITSAQSSAAVAVAVAVTEGGKPTTNTTNTTNTTTPPILSSAKIIGETTDIKPSISTTTTTTTSSTSSTMGSIKGGIEPIFFTQNSQKLFGVVTEIDVTAKHPYKLIPYNVILEDIEKRGVISDFYPSREKIQAFDGKEILLVFDAEQIHGKNFYLCLTEEAMEEGMKQLNYQRRKTELEQRRSNASHGGTAEQEDSTKGWISWGSEKEIDEALVMPNRPPLRLQISHLRKDFCGPFDFSDRDSHDGYVECRSFKNIRFETRMMEMECGVQAVPELADSVAQTNWFRKINTATQYVPINISQEEKLELLNSGEMKDFLQVVEPLAVDFLESNETMNIFQTDFPGLKEEDVALGNRSENTLKEFQSFSYLDSKGSLPTAVSAIDWQPGGRGVVAVSCRDAQTFDERALSAGKVTTSYILVWNFIDPIHPQFILDSPSDVLTFKFHPSNPDIVGGGCLNGQILFWDLSESQKTQNKTGLSKKSMRNVLPKSDEDSSDTTSVRVPCTLSSSIEHSHVNAVSDIMWIPDSLQIDPNGNIVHNVSSSKSYSTQFLTVSSDGRILFWDIGFGKILPEDLSWNPFFSVIMKKPDNKENYSLTKACFVKPLGSSLLLTTSDGDMFQYDWRKDSVAKSKTIIHGHNGPVVCLINSPFFDDIFLTVGDWSMHIWKEGIENPLLSSPYTSSYATVGQWSPTRASVLYIGKSNGKLEIWDLVDKSHSAFLVQSISSQALTSLEFLQQADRTGFVTQLLAIGDAGGSLHILDVPRNLAKPTPHERLYVQQLFTREIKRVESLLVTKAEEKNEEAEDIQIKEEFCMNTKSPLEQFEEKINEVCPDDDSISNSVSEEQPVKKKEDSSLETPDTDKVQESEIVRNEENHDQDGNKEQEEENVDEREEEVQNSVPTSDSVIISSKTSEVQKNDYEEDDDFSVEADYKLLEKKLFSQLEIGE